MKAFVDSVDAKEHITEVLDKEQATRAGDGFCAAVSLKDGNHIRFVIINTLKCNIYNTIQVFVSRYQ